MYMITGAILVLVFTIIVICETIYHTYKIYMTWANGGDISKYVISYDPFTSSTNKDPIEFVISLIIRLLVITVGAIVLLMFWPAVLIGCIGVYIARKHRDHLKNEREKLKSKSTINLRKD